MKVILTDGPRKGKIVHLTEAKIGLSDILERDSHTGAYRMTEADAEWFGKQLREGVMVDYGSESNIKKIRREWESITKIPPSGVEFVDDNSPERGTYYAFFKGNDEGELAVLRLFYKYRHNMGKGIRIGQRFANEWYFSLDVDSSMPS